MRTEVLLLLFHSPACSSADRRLVPIGIRRSLEVLEVELLYVPFSSAFGARELYLLPVVKLPLTIPVPRLTRNYAKRPPLVLLALI